MELSIWEKNSMITYDFVIIGAGITGLSTALSVKDHHPDASVLVLEKGLLPTGASTRNAGFACFGSLTEVLSDVKVMGEQASLELVEKRWHGLKKVKNRTQDRNIGYKNYGGYELLTEQQMTALDELESINSLLKPVFGQNVYEKASEKIGAFGFDQDRVSSLVFNPLEGQIDTGKLMQSLHMMATERGVVVITGAEVTGYTDSGNEVEITTQYSHGTMNFYAGKLAICNNAFAAKLIPDLELKPGRGQVLVTKPLSDLKFKGTFHIDEGYYYFRNFEKRVILGGGRHKAVDNETTLELGSNEEVREDITKLLSEVILPGQKFEIDYFWSGIMAFGPTKEPIIKPLSKNVLAGVRLGGMGVAIGSLVGEMIAEKLV